MLVVNVAISAGVSVAVAVGAVEERQGHQPNRDREERGPLTQQREADPTQREGGH